MIAKRRWSDADAPDVATHGGVDLRTVLAPARLRSRNGSLSASDRLAHRGRVRRTLERIGDQWDLEPRRTARRGRHSGRGALVQVRLVAGDRFCKPAGVGDATGASQTRRARLLNEARCVITVGAERSQRWIRHDIVDQSNEQRLANRSPPPTSPPSDRPASRKSRITDATDATAPRCG